MPDRKCPKCGVAGKLRARMSEDTYDCGACFAEVAGHELRAFWLGGFPAIGEVPKFVNDDANDDAVLGQMARSHPGLQAWLPNDVREQWEAAVAADVAAKQGAVEEAPRPRYARLGVVSRDSRTTDRTIALESPDEVVNFALHAPVGALCEVNGERRPGWGVVAKVDRRKGEITINSAWSAAIPGLCAGDVLVLACTCGQVGRCDVHNVVTTEPMRSGVAKLLGGEPASSPEPRLTEAQIKAWAEACVERDRLHEQLEAERSKRAGAEKALGTIRALAPELARGDAFGYAQRQAVEGRARQQLGTTDEVAVSARALARHLRPDVTWHARVEEHLGVDEVVVIAVLTRQTSLGEGTTWRSARLGTCADWDALRRREPGRAVRVLDGVVKELCSQLPKPAAELVTPAAPVWDGSAYVWTLANGEKRRGVCYHPDGNSLGCRGCASPWCGSAQLPHTMTPEVGLPVARCQRCELRVDVALLERDSPFADAWKWAPEEVDRPSVDEPLGVERCGYRGKSGDGPGCSAPRGHADGAHEPVRGEGWAPSTSAGPQRQDGPADPYVAGPAAKLLEAIGRRPGPSTTVRAATALVRIELEKARKEGEAAGGKVAKLEAVLGACGESEAT